MLMVFSDAWAQACAEALNASAAYRDAARAWEGAVVLLMLDGSSPDAERQVWLDLWHGECRAARSATPADLDACRYILAGSREAWQQLLQGRLAPLMALMTGRLKLTKGNLADLIPFAGAAKELVQAAAGIPATWPDGA